MSPASIVCMPSGACGMVRSSHLTPCFSHRPLALATRTRKLPEARVVLDAQRGGLGGMRSRSARPRLTRANSVGLDPGHGVFVSGWCRRALGQERIKDPRLRINCRVSDNLRVNPRPRLPDPQHGTRYAVDLMAEMPAPSARRLREIGIRRIYRDNQTVQQRGDAARHVLLLLSGRLRSVAYTAGGTEQLTRWLEPGEFSGFSSVLGDAPVPVDLVAVGDVEVLVVPREPLLEFLASDAAASLAVARALSLRINELFDIIFIRAEDTLGSRVWATLQRIAAENGVSRAEPDPAAHLARRPRAGRGCLAPARQRRTAQAAGRRQGPTRLSPSGNPEARAERDRRSAAHDGEGCVMVDGRRPGRPGPRHCCSNWVVLATAVVSGSPQTRGRASIGRPDPTCDRRRSRAQPGPLGASESAIVPGALRSCTSRRPADLPNRVVHPTGPACTTPLPACHRRPDLLFSLLLGIASLCALDAAVKELTRSYAGGLCGARPLRVRHRLRIGRLVVAGSAQADARNAACSRAARHADHGDRLPVLLRA